ncbi:MAG: DsbA family protein [Patescibacteria group bacterium]
MESSEPFIQLADMPVPPSPKAPFDKTKLIMPGAILIGAVIISASILFARMNAGQDLQANFGNQNPPEKVEISLENAMVLGDSKAPVTIVEFADFQCPFCERYYQSNQAMFIKEYVETGKARFVWKDYAFLGQESNWSAEAARCANDQGKFWQYHDYLFSHQGAENSGAFSKANLKKFAVAIGLNAGQFNTCLDSGKYTALIKQETQEGVSIGVNGTPATFINGRMVVDASGDSVGASPFATFKAVIDKELDK